MSNDQDLIKTLFAKYVAGSASPEEIKQLFGLISDKQYDEEMRNLLRSELQETELQDNYDTERWANVFNKVKAETELMEYNEQPNRAFGLRKMAIAASIVVGFGIGGYLWLHSTKPVQTTQLAKNDVAPGKVSATLTLSNGQQIRLSSVNTGVVAKQAGSSISKTVDGKIVYHAQNDNNAELNGINTLTTARGETIQVDLPDGSKVWLNDASSLKYPTTFASASERKVELTGEAYFEVAKDKTHPFRVVTSQQTVTVLGTHFNINSYTDEPAVKTTLLEGSVKVAATGGATVRIKPGEQAILKQNDLKVSQADIESAIAWKNGDFIFKGEGLETAMLRVARWYNVDVVYDASAPKTLELGGWVSRSRNISAVLKMMATTGEVHFKVEGRRVLVTK